MHCFSLLCCLRCGVAQLHIYSLVLWLMAAWTDWVVFGWMFEQEGGADSCPQQQLSRSVCAGWCFMWRLLLKVGGSFLSAARVILLQLQHQRLCNVSCVRCLLFNAPVCFSSCRDDSAKATFFQHLVEDRTESASSYQEFLQHLHQQMSK